MTKFELLKYELGVCQIHVERIHLALEKTKSLWPFSPDYLPLTDGDHIAYLDLFIFRVSRLQDALGSKVFPLLLENLGENLNNKSMLDIIHKLEKIEIINDSQDWLHFRDIRNALSHDYPDSPEFISDTLNKAVIVFEKLQQIYEKIRIKTEEINGES